ncbi:MAG: acetate kinase [bacterium]|nr:acetate kinase [bacterium]
MKILALNCGSSTVKYQLFEDDSPVTGGVETVEAGHSHQEAVEALLDRVDGGGIDGIGHRVVHGGEYYSKSVLIDDEVERRIEECSALAPLHNPHNLTGYRAAKHALPDCPQVAVFDTAFHQTIPRKAFLYGLPYEFYSEERIRRYGFHGTSHRYVSLRYAELTGKDVAACRLITCHLGNGASVCAIDGGRSVDISLGFTPLEGLVMGTRTGDLDPGVVLYLVEQKGLSPEETNTLLNRRSGLLGLSGLTHDMRVLVEEAVGGNERARMAVDVFCYRVRRYVSAFFGVLNGADAVVFTGGIGENSPEVRRRSCDSLNALGIAVDGKKNRSAVGKEMAISAGDTGVWVIPTNEELLIARETARCVGGA